MIRITIEITDTPLKDGTFYGRIEAMPDHIEPVTDHERQMRDWIMNTLEAASKKFVQSEGVTKSAIVRVPLRKGARKDGGRKIRDDRRDTGPLR